MVGNKFNRWEVVALTGHTKYLVFRCSCGTVRKLKKYHILNGRSKSCGCLQRETVSTHGSTGTFLYNAWRSMKNRCRKGNKYTSKYYHDRGIGICEEWENSFDAFARDVGQPPTEKHTIDRIDNDRGYEPGNVRWATRSDQVNNRRGNLRISYGGETKTAGEWSSITGIPKTTILGRYHRGLLPKDILSTEGLNKKTMDRLSADGVTK